MSPKTQYGEIIFHVKLKDDIMCLCLDNLFAGHYPKNEGVGCHSAIIYQ